MYEGDKFTSLHVVIHMYVPVSHLSCQHTVFTARPIDKFCQQSHNT